jgi:hypothetical protein
MGVFKRKPARKQMADRPGIASKYDVPLMQRKDSGRADETDFMADMQKLLASRPPDDAWEEIASHGVLPPGYLWPLRFCRMPLDFWGRENLQRCVEESRDGSYAKVLESVLAALRAIESGTRPDGSELVTLGNTYGLVLVAHLLSACTRLYRAHEGVLSTVFAPATDPVFDGALDERFKQYVLYVHSALRHIDFRIGVETGMPGGDGELSLLKWDERSAADVLVTAVAYIERHAKQVAAEGLEHR